MLTYSNENIKHEVLKHFNVALHSGVFPENWHHTIFQMLPKDGDTRQLKNWRPIAILPIMYKLFARLLYSRISPTLFGWQSEHQHAFTLDKRIEDALLYAELVVEYALEFNTPVWLLSMDLRKAFDTVSHEQVLISLGYHGLDPTYITVLRKLYQNQTGAVSESKRFDIQRGVKQGDVTSAIIFNCVLGVAFENWNFSGSKLIAHPENTFGPIMFSQYTLSRGILKLTAQLAPVILTDEKVNFQIKENGSWKTLKGAHIDIDARTATFRIENWDTTIDIPYRLSYKIDSLDNLNTECFWEGTVRKEPVNKSC